MDYRKQLNELEAKLYQNRQELNKLMGTMQGDSFNERRIHQLQQELDYMNVQLQNLRLAMKNNMGIETQSARPEQVAVQQGNIPMRKPQKEKKDLESIMGKSMMGIFASILIFISLVFFAMLLIPKMNDTMKMVGMYAVSFAFAISGSVLLRKNRENKLYISLASCGAGAIYISLFMTNAYFHRMSDIVLYLVLLMWAVGICCLSKFHSVIFQVIGQIGTAVAVGAGVNLCYEADDSVKLLFLCCFFLVTECIYWLFSTKLPYTNTIINSVGYTLSAAFLAQSHMMYYHKIAFGEGADRQLHAICRIVVSAGLFLVSIAMIAIRNSKMEQELKEKLKKETINIWCNICVIANVLLGCYILQKQLAIMIVVILILVLVECFNRKGEKAFVPLSAVMIVEMLSAYINCPELSEVFTLISVFPIAVVLWCYGVIRKRKDYEIFGLLTSLFFVLNIFMNEPLYLILGILLYVCLIGGLIYRKNTSLMTRNVIYCSLLFFVSVNLFRSFERKEWNGETDFTIYLAVIMIVNLSVFLGKRICGKYTECLAVDGLVSKELITFINGLIMLATTIYLMLRPVYLGSHFVLILLAVAAYSVNAKRLLDSQSRIKSFYVGGKFTLLLITIMKSFDAESIPISIACLVFAIVAIVIGFVGKYKSLRVYGLALTLICIVKLILIDINYSGTMERAVSFFVCGMLCFVVSAIYNKVDKSVGNVQEK